MGRSFGLWHIGSILLVLFGVGTLPVARAQVSSKVTIDKISVTATGGGNWDIVVTGTVTLGDNDTYKGFACSMKDPNGKTDVPYVNLTPPAPGKTATYTATTVAVVQGEWTVNSSLLYTDQTGAPGGAGTSKKFSVPVP